jgi:hypothetical protein
MMLLLQGDEAARVCAGEGSWVLQRSMFTPVIPANAGMTGC